MTLGSFTARAPWLASRSHQLLEPPRLASLASTVERVPLGSCYQAKAFCPGNSADIFFASGNEGLSWICFGASCAKLAQQAWDDPDATIAEAIQHSQAPISVRVGARRGGGYLAEGGDGGDGDGDDARARAVTPELADWLAELDGETRRPFCDADVYCTPAGGPSTASLGWHVDDVDVLLVMCRGHKRFRVAGRSFGSTVVIDTVLRQGDALFIPALTFHTGGELLAPAPSLPFGWGRPQQQPAVEESVMLSVALPWADEAAAEAAQAAAEDWREAVEDAAAALPPRRNTWSFAASSGGQAELASVLSDEAARRFLM